jgi:glycolate oxidase iron-sulfur subunit
MEDLGLDPEPARRVSAKVRDVSELVAERLEELPLRVGPRRQHVEVTYHDPCHLVRSMGISKEPRKLLASLEEVSLIEMPGSDQCCGGAGAFQFEHVEMSAAVTSRKKENILSTGARLVATGCPGCNLTLSGNLYGEGDPAVRHTIQLIAERL